MLNAVTHLKFAIYQLLSVAHYRDQTFDQFYLCSQYLNKYTYASGALREFSVSADWVSSLYKSFHTTIKPIISRIIVLYSHLTFNAIVILFICTKTELCKRLIPNNSTLCRFVPIYLSTK